MLARLMRVALLFVFGSSCIVVARVYGTTIPGGTVLAYTVTVNSGEYDVIALSDIRARVAYHIPYPNTLHLLQGWISSQELLLAGVDVPYLVHQLTDRYPRTQVFDRPPECRTGTLYGHDTRYACSGSERGLWIFGTACVLHRCATPPRHLIPESLVQTWVWSPDGTHIAYFDIAPFTAGLAVIDVATQQVQRVTDTLGAEVPLVSWSPDATMLAYYVLDRGGRTLQVYDLAAQTVTLRLPLDVLVSQQPPEWSPDGRMLAYTTSQTHQLYLVSRVTGETEQMTDQVAEMPKWSPDGRWIAYSIQMGLDAGIHLYNIETGESQPLALFDPLTGTLPGAPYAWQPCTEAGCK